jgi:hypothetical protein
MKMQKIESTKNIWSYGWGLLIIIMLIISCNKEDEPDLPGGEFQHAVFIVNEGNFTAGNASLTYYNYQTGEVQPKVFYRVNGAPLGDVANSVTVEGESLYIVVNNSHVVYKINALTGRFEGKLTGLTSPRQMLLLDKGEALISDLYEKSLVRVNTETMEIVSRIPVGRTSENMLLYNDRIFVANWSAFQQELLNNMIMVIDAETMLLSDSIQVGIEPNSMVLDKQNHLWVLCSGGFMNEELPVLWKINPDAGEVLDTFEFPEINSSPNHLCLNKTGDTLYFLNKHVYRMACTDTHLPENAFIEADDGTNYYMLAVSPRGDIYVTDANDFTRNGMVYRYSANGILKQKFEAGIIPGAIGFVN